MIVIIEGIDRIGKSTCCQHLVDIGYRSMHFSKPEGETQNEKAFFQKGTFDRMFAFISTLEGQDANIVMDRAHLGEYVYGPLYRPDADVDVNYIFDLERDNECQDVLLILLIHRNLDVVRARDDGEGFDIEKLEEEQDKFLEAFDRSHLSKLKIDVTDLDVTEMLAALDAKVHGFRAERERSRRSYD